MEKEFSVLGHDIQVRPRRAVEQPDPIGLNFAAIGEKELSEATATLQKYKQGKASLENRVIEDEEWYRLRHDQFLRRHKNTEMLTPTSAWLFDALSNKHADAMDNYPVPAVLPREPSDEQSAQILSEVVPVVMERNDFEQVYSDCWWDKLKNGCAPYGVFWDPGQENGLGDIVIKPIDLLNIFWEPGVEQIQDSQNLFITTLMDRKLLERQYPALQGKLNGSAVEIAEYVHDESIDTTDKAVVVDWYYKRKLQTGRQILHYVKYVGNTLLFATENDTRYQQNGWYEHGMYPVVFDTLFPEKGTPAGFGYIAIAKDPQMYIDKLSGNILENSLMVSKPRFFKAANTGVNMDQFCDWSQPIVDVEGGSLDETKLRQIEVNPIPGNVLDVLQLKINELKETSSNRDYNSGGTTSGVTAAAAIAALQEAGNKTSRDMISASYRSYTKIVQMVIELMRQFYDEMRAFRISAANQQGYQFVQFSNAQIKDQPMPRIPGLAEQMYRKPIFDIKIKAQKKSPFSQLSQNEMAKEFYSLGFFNPEQAQPTLLALEMMDFEGKEKIVQKVQEGQTLLNLLQQVTQQRDQLAAIAQQMAGIDLKAPDQQRDQGATRQGASQGAADADTVAGEAKAAQLESMTGYGQRLAQRAKPDMSEMAGNPS